MPVKKSSRKSARRASPAASRPTRARPAFPYTTRPNALRRFLAEVPRRPRPPRVNAELLSSWNLGGGENKTILRVLKALGLVGNANEPTDVYTSFMREGSGPAVLGTQIRRVYAPLFEATLEPYRESTENLRNLFNIHSSGAAGTIDFQIQTFKALCDYARFDGATIPATPGGTAIAAGIPGSLAPASSVTTGDGGASIHIDLHIHLPESRTSREYQYIIQDIAHFIYGREQAASQEPEARS